MREDGSGDAFLHAGVVQQSGHDPADLPSGAILLVRIEVSQKGPQVSEVLEVDKATAAPQPRSYPSRQPAEHPAASQPTRMIGTVKWYSPEKRFGFVAVEGGQREVFVHASALQRSNLISLSERVAMEVGEGRKGLEAVSIGLTG